MSALSLIAALAPLFFSHQVTAQSVTAVCTYADWTHFQGQTPCQIWGKLQAACDSSATVPVLDTSTNNDATYPSPSGSKATPCQCNVVAYNLMAGCSWCQPGVFSNNWVSESAWKAGCSSYDSSGNLPPQANSLRSSIPPWAMQQENGGAWLSFEASSIAVAGTTATIGGNSFTASPTFSFSGFSSDTFTDDPTNTAFSGPTITGPFSGGDDSDTDTGTITNSVGKVVGITLGVVLGIYAIIYISVLIVFCVRQKNRKAWYGPTAAFYEKGGRFGDLSVNQPLLGSPQNSNPFMTPMPSATYPTSPYLSTTPPAPYPPTTPPASYPPATPPVSGGYDSNANLGQGYPNGQYQAQTAQTGGYDASLLYNGQQPSNSQQYIPPSDPSMVQHGGGSTRNVPEL